MGVPQFRKVRAVNHVGDGFRLGKVHFPVEERAASELARLGEPHTADFTDSADQFAHNERVAVRVKFQHVFARIGIRAFKKDVDEAVDGGGRRKAFAFPGVSRARVADRSETDFARLDCCKSRIPEQSAHHVANLRPAHADGGHGTHAGRGHRGYDSPGIHAAKIVNRNPGLAGFSFVTSLLTYVRGLHP